MENCLTSSYGNDAITWADLLSEDNLQWTSRTYEQKMG